MTRVNGNLASNQLPQYRRPDDQARPDSAPGEAADRPARISAAVASIVAMTGDGVSSVQANVAERTPEARTEAYVRQHFEQEFGKLASDPDKFHAMMKEVYGAGYDKNAAEQMRQQALKGDYSWLPKVEFVDGKTLGGAHGAYDKESGTVFLSKELLGNPKLAAQTFMEEAGHHIDTKLNKTDAQGDEGEMFRRLMAGEKLTDAQKAEIRAENDKGTITVNGKTIEVEFWNPFKAAGKAIKKAAKAVGNAVKGVAKGVGRVFEGVGKGIKNVFVGIGEGVGGFFSNLFKGKIGDAFGALWKGIDKAVFKSTGAVLDGVIDGAQTAFNGVTELLPGFLKKPVRWVSDRVFDAGRSVVMGAHGIIQSAANNLVEAGGTFLGGIGKIFKGDFKEGFKDMGLGLLKVVQTPVDALILGLGKGISAIQTLIGLEPPGRKLTDAEIAELKKVYGDSIDYDQVRIKEGFSGLFSTNDRPFAHGNTLYMKDQTVDQELLTHEMMHIWQYQNGGSDYMSEALVSQWWGKGYDWEASVPGTPWEDLEPEQQAEFMEKAWASGFFNDPEHNSFIWNGVDYTDYLKDALKKVRAGEGAP
ncbi:MAG: hypothetical protein H6730_05210 [Deltaproteobacteria bacterium]|nr:hypothetical protein [Deltaproteobacteria bacterium]